MKRYRIHAAAVVALLAFALTAEAQILPWLNWTLLPQNQMDEIIGEASGETAWKTIASIAAFNRDRRPEEFKEMFLETRVITGLLNDYGITGFEVKRYPDGTAWDASKGELWETQPRRRKIASFNDMVPMLAAYSSPVDVTADLVWIGKGSPDEIKKADVKGKIVVTDGNLLMVVMEACGKQGAAGIVVINTSRQLDDPLQLPWAQIKMPSFPGMPALPDSKAPVFGFTLPAREGEFLKQRLLSGEKIKARAQVEAKEVPYFQEVTVASIPGTEPEAGEIVFSAHLFEGKVKQGANDDISGSACILEVARVINTLIADGRLARPKRTLRFIWAPEYSGTGKWVKDHPEIIKNTLCNINMDMVGEWLSLNRSFFSLMRTTYARPHYINDVMENYYRFVGEASREKIHGMMTREKAPRIVAPFGADEPFPYSMEWHFGSSDHEVFNDWSVGIPGVMMIAWPDRWYHTSGDLADKADPTQLKRVAVIGAAAAYTIASADDKMAAKIASETFSNGARRIPLQLQAGIANLNQCSPDAFAETYKKAWFSLEAALINEKNTLVSILELAPGSKQLSGHIDRLIMNTGMIGDSAKTALRNHMETVASGLHVSPVGKFALTPLEAKAAKLKPRLKDKVRAHGYMGLEEFVAAFPEEMKSENPMMLYIWKPGISDLEELRRLIDGKRSVLDIKRTLDAETSAPSDLQVILNYLETLKRAGFIEM